MSRVRPGTGSDAGSRPAAPGLGREQPHDRQLHRDEVLHVDRAAAPDVAVGDVAGERVVGPPLRRRRHDVEMAEQQERLAAGPVAAEAGGHGAAARDGLEDLGDEAGVGERVGDPAWPPAARRRARPPAAG